MRTQHIAIAVKSSKIPVSEHFVERPKFREKEKKAESKKRVQRNRTRRKKKEKS